MTDNYCQSIVDNAVRKNADFQWKSGLEPKIVRTAEYKCCKWCSNLEGTYRYEDVKKLVMMYLEDMRIADVK